MTTTINNLIIAYITRIIFPFFNIGACKEGYKSKEVIIRIRRIIHNLRYSIMNVFYIQGNLD